jgi:hypothetical protein
LDRQRHMAVAARVGFDVSQLAADTWYDAQEYS